MSSGMKKFLLLWIGELISSIGGGLTSFGLGVYVFQKTGSAAGMALVTLLGFLPTLLFTVPAGVLADRYDRRFLMMIGDGFSGLGILYIFLCMIRGGANLVQICIGVFISAIFSSLLDPSYRATITDLLSKEEFSKASGLVSLAGSARYLFSPIIAGLLLAYHDISLLLLIDVSTFFVTITTTFIVRQGIKAIQHTEKQSFLESIKEGWSAIHIEKGVFVLVLCSSLITLFLGTLQILVEPMILSFADSKVLGIIETLCASGMLASGILLGSFGIKKEYGKVLQISFFMAGIFMIGMSIFENPVCISIFGFFFFATLPFCNNCMDYLCRTNIPDALQGRAWGFIGFLSQIGYVIAYAVSGLAADGLGSLSGMGVGRGAAIMIGISGVFLSLVAVTLLRFPAIKELEKRTE
ncbi:MFS transporter [Oribacterium parvum]|uniref:MFS transporter n=1 Tax=Oribacterium parvum TaxID=1501329 RepID=UPI0028E7AF70|nr:MFS transporter [Oribacterium parvum]